MSMIWQKLIAPSAAASRTYDLYTLYEEGQCSATGISSTTSTTDTIDVGDAPISGDTRWVIFAVAGGVSGAFGSNHIIARSGSTNPTVSIVNAASGDDVCCANHSTDAFTGSGSQTVTITLNSTFGGWTIDWYAIKAYTYYTLSGETLVNQLRDASNTLGSFSQNVPWEGSPWVAVAVQSGSANTFTFDSDLSTTGMSFTDGTEDVAAASVYDAVVSSAASAEFTPMTGTGSDERGVSGSWSYRDTSSTCSIAGTTTTGNSTTTVTAGNTFNVTLPSGISDGDFVVVNLAGYTASTNPGANFEVPAGWSVMQNAAFGRNFVNAIVCKLCDGTEGTSLTITWSSGASQSLAEHWYHARRVAGTAGWLQTGAIANGSATSYDPAGMASSSGTTQAGLERVYIYSVIHAGDTTAYPSNFTDDNQATVGTNGRLVTSVELGQTTTFYNPTSFTIDSGTASQYVSFGAGIA